jgi:5-oxoprolinase (ATP-hydrolysing)
MFANLRYQGTDTSIMVPQQTREFNCDQYASIFKKIHETEFGFNFHERAIIIDNVRVRSVGV